MTDWAPRRKPALFVHIPKTAGMTIRALLSSQYDMREKAPAVDWAALRNLPRPLVDYKLYVGHFRYFLRRILPPGFKVFTFLRDPVERSISHLKHMATDPNFHEVHKLAAGRSLIEIARDPRIAPLCSNVMTGYLSMQREGVTDDDLRNFVAEDKCVRAPTRIDDAFAALQAMDFVGFVDDIEADFARLCDMLELHAPETLPVINAEAERPRLLTADDEVRQIVKENNALDCALWEAAQLLRANRPPLPDRPERLLRLLTSGAYPLVDDSLSLPASGPLPGFGFWPQEGEWPNAFRWTGPHGEMRLDLPLHPETSFLLEMVCAFPLDIGSLVAYLDDKPVALRREPLGGFAARLQLDIPAPRPLPFATVRLVADRTLKPSPTDHRSLGFVLRGIRVERGK